MMINNLLKDKNGKIIISCILGLGLASLFKKVCIDDNCLIIKSHPQNEIVGHTFKTADNKCYQYKPIPISCPIK
jgi:hypothetical protein